MIRAGFDSGTTIRVRIRRSLAPSMRAASMRSRGIPRKNCRSRKMKNGVPEERRDDERQVGVDPAQLRVDDVERDERDLGRQHHRRQHDHEHDVAARPLDDGEPVGDEAARDQGADHGGHGVEQGVPEGPQEVHLRDGRRERVENTIGLGISDRRRGDRLRLRLERRRDHPHEGQQVERREHDEQHDGRDVRRASSSGVGAPACASIGACVATAFTARSRSRRGSGTRAASRASRAGS